MSGEASTLTGRRSALAKVCDLMNPESVKEAIASRAVKEGTKKKLVEIMTDSAGSTVSRGTSHE